MSDVLVLDTHALVWFLLDDPRLGTAADQRLSDPTARIVVPAIALAEACFMAEAGRTPLRSAADLLDVIGNVPRLHVAPLTTAVIRRGAGLTAIRDIHRPPDRRDDAPADRPRTAGGPRHAGSRDHRIEPRARRLVNPPAPPLPRRIRRPPRVLMDQPNRPEPLDYAAPKPRR